MNIVALALDGLLATLLVAALSYGVRLERKLKALRDGQAGFVEAVRTLDAAARRAEAGLDTLRRTTEEAQDGLHDRILKAREVRAELERLIGRAERFQADNPIPETPDGEPLPRQRLSAQPAPREQTASPGRAPSARVVSRAAHRPAARGLDEDLFEIAASADRGDVR